MQRFSSVKLSRVAAAGSVWAFVAGCGSAPPPQAFENRTFYQYDDAPSASGRSPFERPYPPLDQKALAATPEYTGVSVLGGTVRLSRPANWRIRRASLNAERRYIEYVSPNEYLFAIYERTESAGDPWRDILSRYEEDARHKGVEFLGTRVPVSTWNTQGREYVLRRTVKGQRAPYANVSREVVLRSEHRIDVVQIVHQGDSVAPIGGELLRVMESLEVL
jgi:hypothetical protein